MCVGHGQVLLFSSPSTLHFQWRLSAVLPPGLLYLNVTARPALCEVDSVTPACTPVTLPVLLGTSVGVALVEGEVSGLLPGTEYTVSVTVPQPAPETG